MLSVHYVYPYRLWKGIKLISRDQKGDSSKTDLVSSPDHICMQGLDELFSFAGSFWYSPECLCFITDMTVLHRQNLTFLLQCLTELLTKFTLCIAQC